MGNRTRTRTHDLQAIGSEDLPSINHIGGMLSERISGKRHRTPEGFLLCEDVPIARTGEMHYGPNETPIKTNDRGLTVITRDARTLFHPRTIASFEGKSVTNDHPPLGVTTRNFKHVTVGHIRNVRPGKGQDADTLRADLLITDHQAIEAVTSGKREVSAGYDADYVPTGRGTGKQINIVGNHVALVPRGRCGPRCAIGDSLSPSLQGKSTMPTPRKHVADADRKRFIDAVAAAAAAQLDDDELVEDDASHVHVHLHGNAATNDAATEDAAADVVAASPAFQALAAQVATLVEALGPDTTTNDADTTTQTAATVKTADLEPEYKAMMADAEILVPGFRVPVFDAAAQAANVSESMNAIRRKALDNFNSTVQGAIALQTLHGSASAVDTTALSNADAAALFKSAAGAKRLLNNAQTTNGSSTVKTNDSAVQQPRKGMPSIAEINAQNAKMFPRPA